MRMPGSRNTKEGASLPVEVVHMHLTARYEVGDLEEWLDRAGPAIRRKVVAKGAGPAPVADNPFLAAAAALGFKPPIDVRQRLAAMSYQGVGEACIHNTQLAVSASLLARGEDVEDVVELLLEATKAAAGQDGARWRWDREERTIRGMCADWVRKHPDTAARALKPAPGLPKPQARQLDRDSDDVVREGSTGAVVHNLREERQRREKPAKRKADDRAPIHVVLGEAVLAAMASRNQAVIFMRKAAWLYQGGLWSMEVDGLKGWLDVQIEMACRALSIDGSNRVRSEARGYIQSNPDLWRDEVLWDEHGKIPTRSGLVDPLTLTIEPARPEHYCTWLVDAEYDPTATCPLWEEMISDTFGDRPTEIRASTVETLREVLGCALIDVKPRALSKALCLVGGSNYGKSGVLEVFSGLFGRSSITAGLESLEGTHGLMAFVRRDPWVLHEAFDQSKWHFSSTVKAIITGEPVPINIKNGPIITTRVRSPIFWGTNHPPQFREATRAIVNRLIVIECRREFREGEFVGVGAEARRRGIDSPAKLVLREERSGLLNWAVAGLRAALERGSIAVTQEMKASADEIHRDSNLAAGFLEECCEFDRDMRVAVPDFCAAFAVWWLENKGEDRRTPSNEAISKAVIALADRRLASHPKEMRDERRRYYGGIILNRRGVDLWKRAYEAKLFEGKLASTTPADESVTRRSRGAAHQRRRT
ncbi:UNVERIFIED_ORG: hypothetical protein M2438_002683 [Methylobacterium sp. SuP10 SLI 274]|nr:hypothetical protein [Methylorubrum extorquens]MDF9863915.1 hypothetical protein [Methylorubrum pseudosasae]MDH6637508.1 hypothetical protein [Methylobacterium sp. SuP10 SLI 274]MDH6666688.1 hypothetical protein [Methylorubrum zatmanii]